MDESRLIDWYDVVEQVANGRFTGHACPLCGARPLETAAEGATVRVRCPTCGEGFEGRMGHGRDDAFFAEAQADAARRRAPAAPKPGEAHPPVAAAPTSLTVNANTAGASAAPAASTREVPRPRTAAGRLLAANEPEPGAPPPQKKPWNWSLPAENAGDLDALMLWTDIVESVHNGRQAGLRCPFCSEPLSQIDHSPPYVRIRCGVCNEGFEGRIG
jgi:ribosomal protein S27E